MIIESRMPVLDKSLEDVDGLPPGVVRGLKSMGLYTVYALVDWADEPDQSGRMGLSKLRAIPKVGPKRIRAVDSALIAQGVDLSR